MVASLYPISTIMGREPRAPPGLGYLARSRNEMALS
jgi:hypothetical protein